MAVIKENEIELNSIKYPLTGKVRPILSAKFAEKMVIGDFTKASNPEVDSWVIQDQRGGILAEEMDEARQANRAYWSTCNLGFLGHVLLPSLATVTTTPVAYKLVNPTTTTDGGDDWDNDDNTIDGDYATSAQTNVSIAAASWSAYLYFNIAATDIVGIKVKARVANDTSTPLIDAAVFNGGWNAIYTNEPLFTDGTIPMTLFKLATHAGVTQARVRLYNSEDPATNIGYIYEFEFVTAAGTLGTAVTLANYNANLYYASGVNLFKLNDTGTAWTLVNVFEATITALTASVGNNLYIFLGDSTNYYTMNTSERFWISDSANANLGIAWDSKLFKMNTTGQMAYSSDPEVAAPTWANDGDLADEGLASGDVHGLFIYRDAAGNPIVYAGTKKGLYAHSFGNDKWVATELSLPDHATAGKGVVTWRDKAYISAGLDTFGYQTGGAGTSIVSMGLSTDDGLPQLYGGEIVKFIKGYNEFFALVDSTYEGDTSYSQVMAYDGRGWQSWWLSGSTNVHLYTGIVSTKVAHRLWFVVGTSLYYIPLQKGIRNPKKVSTFAYDTAGVHITPWFDANWVGQKLALQFKVFCKDVTANETVVVDYRIDHIETDLTTGWNNLGTIALAGNEVETTYTFGSSLGTNFKAIQFRFTLGRDGDGSNPEYDSPDVQYAVLEYQKIIKPTWGWAFTIDCTKTYDGRAPEQLLDAVVTAAELETLTPFLYKDTTYYVRVKSVEGERLTGDGRKGTYNVTVLKPI